MAGTKISLLSESDPLDGSELVPIVQDGATVRATAQDIADLSPGTPPEDLSDLIDEAFDDTQGAILARTAFGWEAVSPGDLGDVWTSGGAGADAGWEAPAGGGGSGTSKVTKSAVSLGSQVAAQATYTYYTVSSTAARGLMSYLLITASGAGMFDLVIRGAGSDSGELYLRADSIQSPTYLIGSPIYYENDVGAQDFYVGIKNRFSETRSFTLTSLRMEKFA